jgi:hypothetical protein
VKGERMSWSRHQEDGRKGKRTKHLLNLDLVVKRNAVGDKVLLLNEVEPFRNDGVVLVLVLANLEENLDHVLNALVDVALVEDGAETVEDTVVGTRRVLSEESADLAHEGDSDLDTVVRRALEEKDEHLEGENLVSDLLIDELGEEGCCCRHRGLWGEKSQFEEGREGKQEKTPCRYACNSCGTGE